MSLITACPACQTQFEVNDEQLQAYAGKVRCGECNHVFDARSSMVEALETTPVAVNETLETVQADGPVEPAEATESVSLSEPLVQEGSETSIPQYDRVEADTLYAAVAPAESARLDSSEGASPETYNSDIYRPETQTAETYSTEIYDSEAYPDPAVTLDSPTAELDAPLTSLDEVKEKADQNRVTSWNLDPEEANTTAIPEFLRKVSFHDEELATPEKTASRWVFPLLSGLLVVTLLLQFIYFTRTSLAANYPFTKPLLQSACKVAHCAVSLPKDITQLTIDDADIQEHREREGVLVFSSVLINHGAVAQAYPMIELTLTNMADEPVLRKILTPKEYLPASSRADQGLTAQQEQPVKATLGIEEKAVTGFRVAIAY